MRGGYFDLLLALFSRCELKKQRQQGDSGALLTMFFDLNVPYSPDDPEISHTLNFLAERTSLLPLHKTRLAIRAIQDRT